jgi:large subunit ribosomal protein L10
LEVIMRRERKEAVVSELAEKLSRATIAITTNYRGVSVAEMTELRRQLRRREVEYRVIKNTLASFAAEQAGREGLKDIIAGPTAIAFGYSDVVEPAKALLGYIQSAKGALSITGGLLQHRVLSAAEVTALATLPPKEVIIARLMAGMQGGLFALVNVLSGTLSSLLNMLNARIGQLEGG